jgi:hypothetical protein
VAGSITITITNWLIPQEEVATRSKIENGLVIRLLLNLALSFLALCGVSEICFRTEKIVVELATSHLFVVHLASD